MSPPRSQSGLGSFLSRAGTGRHRTYLDADREHSAALESLKQQLVAAGHTTLPAALVINRDIDATLLRFLRARKYNVEAAFTMLKKSLAWRVQVGADNILEHPIDPRVQQTVRECRPSSYIGYDGEHRPVFVERLGKLDGRRMEKEGASDQLALSYHLREMEFMSQVVFAEASSAAAHTVDRVVSVMDAAGLTLSALTGFAQRLLRLITAMDSDNYPECCHAIYIANGGAAFSAIWRLVSPFIDKGTREKVHVIGSGKAAQQVLFEALGKALVPSFLGGQLDYDRARQEWLAKMDQAIAERQQSPLQQAPLPVLPNVKLEQPQQPAVQLQPQRSSHSGPLQWLRVGAPRSSASSEGGDGWATPRSAMSRYSSTSGHSVYFDAPESFVDAASGASSPTNAADGDAHQVFAQHKLLGTSSPEPAGSIAGSMSVGPHSRTRSQLSQQSGFTTATVGQGPGHGLFGAHGEVMAGHHQAGSSISEHGDELVGFDESAKQQPVCGCRCVIC